eukprot:65054_1
MVSRIKQTDVSLSKYYKLHNIPYYDNDDIGKFSKWADDNGFDSDGIEEEFAMEYTESSLLDMDEQFPPKNLKPKQIINILKKCWTDPNAYEPVNIIEKEQVSDIENQTEQNIPSSFDFTMVKFIENDPVSDTENQTEQKIEYEFDNLNRSKIVIYGYARIKCNILIHEVISKIIMNFYHHKFRILSFSTTILDERYANRQSYQFSHNNRRVTNCRQTGNMLVSELGINGGYKKGIHVFRYNLFLENTAQFGNATRMFWGVQAFGADIEKNINRFSVCSKYIFGWKSHGKHNVKQDK